MSRPGTDFDEYVSARSPGLIRFAWLLTGDRHEAEDVVQTALAKLCQRWERVSRTEELDAYVRRSVVNASHSRFRRRRVPQVPLEHAREVGQEASGYRLVEERQRLVAALAQLPRRQRQVVVLRYLEDLSEAATAEAIGCAVGTVKSTASRGLAQLRELLDADATTASRRNA